MIGEAMPRFQRLSAAFKDDPEFLQVMGLFYEDILEFHGRAYKYFRQRGALRPSSSLCHIKTTQLTDHTAWKMVFDSLWKSFNLRFQAILQSLRKHRDLIDYEANALNITEAKAWRHEQLDLMLQWRVERASDLERAERDRLAAQTKEAVAWFGANEEQEDTLAKLLKICDPNVALWMLEEPTIRSWLSTSQEHSFVWLNGKPGARESRLDVFAFE